MNKKYIKYIIGVAVLVVVIILALVMCGKDSNEDEETSGVEGGLQVEETGEGDSIDFEDFDSEDESEVAGSNTDTDNDGVVNAEDDDDDNDGKKDTEDDDDDEDGVTDTKDPDHPSYEGTGDGETGDNKEDNKEENKGEDEETNWSPFF